MSEGNSGSSSSSSSSHGGAAAPALPAVAAVPMKNLAPVATASAKVPRRKKDKSMPRRPLSAYNIFFRDERQRILDMVEAAGNNAEAVDDDFAANAAAIAKEGKKVGPEARFQAVARTIAQRWKALGLTQRTEYEQLAATEMEQYKLRKAQYLENQVSQSGLANRLAAQKSNQDAKQQLGAFEQQQRHQQQMLAASRRSSLPPAATGLAGALEDKGQQYQQPEHQTVLGLGGRPSFGTTAAAQQLQQQQDQERQILLLKLQLQQQQQQQQLQALSGGLGGAGGYPIAGSNAMQILQFPVSGGAGGLGGLSQFQQQQQQPSSLLQSLSSSNTTTTGLSALLQAHRQQQAQQQSPLYLPTGPPPLEDSDRSGRNSSSSGPYDASSSLGLHELLLREQARRQLDERQQQFHFFQQLQQGQASQLDRLGTGGAQDDTVLTDSQRLAIYRRLLQQQDYSPGSGGGGSASGGNNTYGPV